MPAVVEDRVGVGHPVGLPVDFPAPVVDPAGLIVRAEGSKWAKARSRQTRGAVDIRTHGHARGRPSWRLRKGKPAAQAVLEPAHGCGILPACSGRPRRSPAMSPWLRIGATTPPRRPMRSIWSPRLPASCATLWTSLVP